MMTMPINGNGNKTDNVTKPVIMVITVAMASDHGNNGGNGHNGNNSTNNMQFKIPTQYTMKPIC